MAAGVVIRADVLHSSRGKCEECASGSGFFVRHAGNTHPIIVTTASWLMHLWEMDEELHWSCLERWIRDNVSFSVIAQLEGSKCTRPQSASLFAIILLENLNQTLLNGAYPHSEYFDCRPTSSLVQRRPSWTERVTECLSSVLVLRVKLPWAGVEGDWPALELSSLSTPSLHVGDEVVVQATPLADACPDIFINSMIRGSICGYHGDVLLLDAPCPVGCEGGLVMGSFYCKGNTLQLNNRDPIAMVIVPVLLKEGSLTGLGLAVHLSVVGQAVRNAMLVQDKGPGVARVGVPDGGVGHLVHDCNVIRYVCGVLSSSSSWGTGMVLDQRHVLTCAHVVNGGSRVEVLTQDGCRVGARVVFSCHTGSPLDVAVLKTDAPLSHDVTLMDCWSLSSRENGCCGDKVTVAGYSLHRPTLSHCLPLLTSGCVSKVHNFENIPVMYQVTAAVHSGCSGGVVVAVDTHQPIGMVTSVIIDTFTGKPCPHIGFVLPLSFIREHIQAFLQSKDCEHLVAMEAKGGNPTIKHIWRLSIEAALKCGQSKL